MSYKTRAQQICEFLFEKPDSSIQEIESAFGMDHHLTGVHLYRLKKSGFIINAIRGRYRVTDKGLDLARKARAGQATLVGEEPKRAERELPEVTKSKKQSQVYRVIVQGEAFAHDAIVDEELARKMVNFLINKKRRV